MPVSATSERDRAGQHDGPPILRFGAAHPTPTSTQRASVLLPNGPAHGKADVYARPALRDAGELELSPQRLHALGHADHSQPAMPCRRIVLGQAAAIVLDAQQRTVAVASQRNVHARGIGMLLRVVQGFLRDTEQLQLLLFGEAEGLLGLAVHLEFLARMA